MNHFTHHPAFYNQPIRLSAEEQAQPLAVIKEFFEVCPLSQGRQLLWHMAENALRADYTLYDSAKERSQLLWFYRELERTMEACVVLANQQR